MIHFGAVVLDSYALTMSPHAQRAGRWNASFFGGRVYFVHQPERDAGARLAGSRGDAGWLMRSDPRTPSQPA